jgi:hypothetical protein
MSQPIDWRQELREPLTPVEVEARLRASISLLTRAQDALRHARDLETESEITYKTALYRATLSAEAPTVERGGATVGERDAWVAQRCETEWASYRRAQTVREAAQDHLRTVRDIVEVVRSLGASVRTAYEGAGYSGGR